MEQFLSNNEGKDMVVFHHADNDGKTCAAIIQELYPDAWFYPVNHNKEVKWDLMDPTIATVMVVDFSFPLETMKELNSMYHLVWIDHHPIIHEYEQQGFTCDGLRESTPGRSAAMLTWEYMHPGVNPPWAVKYVSDYDTWKFDYGNDTRAFDAALGQMELTPVDRHAEEWKKLFRDANFVHKLLATGKRILNYIKLKNEVIVNDGAFETSIDGVPALACNVKDANSSLFDSLHRPDRPIRILYRYFHNIRKVRVSIYSLDEQKHPANEIAKRHGGNGHAGASGCVCDLDKLPFNQPKPIPESKLSYTNIFQPILDSLQHDPLANRYANQGILPVIYSSGTPAKMFGYDAMLINHPALFTNTWYVTGLNLEYDLGVYWNMCNTGWYRYRIYSLNPELSLEDLQKKIGTGKIVDDALWVYAKEMMPIG